MCVPYWFSPWECCSATAFQTSVVSEQRWGGGGAWWLWSRGQLAEIFPYSFAGILSQYIQWDPLAGPLCQHLQLVVTAGLSRWSLQSISSSCCVVTSRPSCCWRISACFLRGHGHHVSLLLCCCFLAFDVFLCSHCGSLKSSLEIRICDCFLTMAYHDCFYSSGNAWVHDFSELAALLGLFGPILIASYYLESACAVQVPNVPSCLSFLDSVVPLGFSPVTMPFLSWLVSP